MTVSCFGFAALDAKIFLLIGMGSMTEETFSF